ncbi:MAG: hypothetical protein ACI8W7_002363 [Gammaproteobacteria bacterium]|jgi:hypothetical protein
MRGVIFVHHRCHPHDRNFGVLMSNLIGTWHLVATRAWDDDNNELPVPYGPIPRGVVAFDDNQRMMCVLVDGRQQLPAASASREYASYTGQYTFVDNVLTTRCDCSSDPARVGTDQVRQVRFSGVRLILRPPVRVNDNGVNVHRELEWEKLA